MLRIHVAVMKILIIVFVSVHLNSCIRLGSNDAGFSADRKSSVYPDTCDNPDADISCSFLNMPASISEIMQIGGKDEPGEKLSVKGTIYKADGKTPFPGVLLYAYHTDSRGYYSKIGKEKGAQKWHGKLHGWCMTDSKGNFEIRTIKPARYPDNSMPAHIHAAVKLSDGSMFWISDFVFSDDDLVNEKYLSSLSYPGGTGVVTLHRQAGNSWLGTRDIVLR